MNLPNGWLEKTCLMAVINITPDSFSDGGKYLDPESALESASLHLNNGANVLDLGAQSTRPGATLLSPEEELSRLIPVLKEIRSSHKNTIISIDTFWSIVAERALNEGANWINDVSGGRLDQDIFKVVAESGCPYVLTHSRGNSESMNSLASYVDVVIDVRNELLKSTELALNSGIMSDQLIWDPGLGFAKTTEHNLDILHGLDAFTSEGFPLLVGPSRKRFVGDVTQESDPLQRVFGTAAVVCRCVQANVAMVRVHDVKAISQTLKMASSLW